MKKTILSLMMLFSVITSFANDVSGEVETYSYQTPWYISFGIGAQMYRGENEWKMRMEDNIAPSLTISGGKWITQCFGVDLGVNIAEFKGLWQAGYEYHTALGNLSGEARDQKFREITKDLNFRTFDKYASKERPNEDLYRQSGYYCNAYLRMMFNLSNAVSGYNANRRSNFIPYIGAGYIHDMGKNSNGKGAPTLNLGLMWTCNVGSNLSLHATFNSALVGDNFDGENSSGRSMDAIIGLNAGVVYTFNGSEKSGTRRARVPGCEHGRIQKPCKTPCVKTGKGAPGDADINGDINAGRDVNININSNNGGNGKKPITTDDLEDRLNRLEKLLQDNQQSQDSSKSEITVIAGELFPYYVNFALNDSMMVNREKVNLNVISKIMKADPKTHYIISGYADKQTGSSEHNKVLSNKRAETVKNTLVNEMGVDASQISIETHGGVGNMFYNDNTLSRCVIITIKK